jgi:hypothetical protein
MRAVILSRNQRALQILDLEQERRKPERSECGSRQPAFV